MGDACDCLGDLDSDIDVDGYDLTLFIDGGIGISLEDFAMDYGKLNCDN